MEVYIQKAMNANKGDDAKLHQLKLARKAMNQGDIEKAKKIVSRYLKEGKVCESCGKMHEGSCGKSIAEKLAKQLKSN